jgi:uncharacterized membrane protein YfcA
MAQSPGLLVPALAGVIAFIVQMLLYRSWPPSLGDLVGPLVIGVAVAIGAYIGLRIVARRKPPA